MGRMPRKLVAVFAALWLLACLAVSILSPGTSAHAVHGVSRSDDVVGTRARPLDHARGLQSSSTSRLVNVRDERVLVEQQESEDDRHPEQESGLDAGSLSISGSDKVTERSPSPAKGDNTDKASKTPKDEAPTPSGVDGGSLTISAASPGQDSPSPIPKSPKPVSPSPDRKTSKETSPVPGGLDTGSARISSGSAASSPTQTSASTPNPTPTLQPNPTPTVTTTTTTTPAPTQTPTPKTPKKADAGTGSVDTPSFTIPAGAAIPSTSSPPTKSSPSPVPTVPKQPVPGSVGDSSQTITPGSPDTTTPVLSKPTTNPSPSKPYKPGQGRVDEGSFQVKNGANAGQVKVKGPQSDPLSSGTQKSIQEVVQQALADMVDDPLCKVVKVRSAPGTPVSEGSKYQLNIQMEGCRYTQVDMAVVVPDDDRQPAHVVEKESGGLGVAEKVDKKGNGNKARKVLAVQPDYTWEEYLAQSAVSDIDTSCKIKNVTPQSEEAVIGRRKHVIEIAVSGCPYSKIIATMEVVDGELPRLVEWSAVDVPLKQKAPAKALDADVDDLARFAVDELLNPSCKIRSASPRSIESVVGRSKYKVDIDLSGCKYARLAVEMNVFDGKAKPEILNFYAEMAPRGKARSLRAI